MAGVQPLGGGALVGKYRLQSELGNGGMGAVWLGVHIELGWSVAVKILHAEYSNHDDIVQRFFNEARAAGAVKDPGIVEIFDFGFTPSGRAYIVMELLDGESLEVRLRREGKLAPAVALRIARQVSTSLGAAHARGIVHRDLKPDNIFMARDPHAPGGERPKILDFGIAKLEWSSNVATRTNAVMGTPTYMSPEQCRGAKEIDHRADVYSMGCLIFALLAGYPPFFAEGAGQVFLMHLQQTPPTIASRGVHVPPDVEALVTKCLAKDPAHRYASGTELATALETIVPAEPSVRPTSIIQAAENVALPVAPPSNAMAWLGVAVLLVVVVIVIIAVAMNR